MTQLASGTGRETEGATVSRELGRMQGALAGPTLVVVAGIHGNERAGTVAARRVLSRLARERDAVRGEFLALVGNLAALRMGRRYQSKDLNRVWSEASVAALQARSEHGTDDPEDAEQRALLGCFDAALGRARGDVFLADLHTTSAAGTPFVLFGDTPRQRAFAFRFPLPAVIGLEEQVDGTLSEYLTRRGCITVAVEGGQHDDPGSVDSLEAVLWIALSHAGNIEPARFEAELEAANALLGSRRGSLPRVLEVVERHAIRAEDAFRMEPGFSNLDRARGGQLLARDARGEIRAPRDGMVILPLYQGQGSDGFFWGREVGPLRMRASTTLRAMGLERFLPYLPGVQREGAHPDRLRVDVRVARYYPLDVFHLFGYRRIRQDGAVLTVVRQPA
jgi:succinylglutamate desuccinylase